MAINMSETSNIILEIDLNVLINAVKSRPALFDTSRKGYHDVSLKKRLWDQIYHEVFTQPVWDSLTARQKGLYGKLVQTRWASLRHCFRRELAAQKNKTALGKFKKRRKYLYFDSLLFLLPFTEKYKNKSSEFRVKENRISDGILDSSEQLDTYESGNSSTSTNYYNTEDIIMIKEEKLDIEDHFNKGDRNELELANVLPDRCSTIENSACNNCKEEDDSFFRSLVPSMRDLTTHQKLTLRMEIMKTILDFRRDHFLDH